MREIMGTRYPEANVLFVSVRRDCCLQKCDDRFRDVSPHTVSDTSQMGRLAIWPPYRL